MDFLTATAPILYKKVVVTDTNQLQALFCDRNDSEVSSSLRFLLSSLFPGPLLTSQFSDSGSTLIPNQPLPLPLPNPKAHRRLRRSPYPGSARRLVQSYPCPPNVLSHLSLSLRRTRPSTARLPPNPLPGSILQLNYPRSPLLPPPPSSQPHSLHLSSVRGPRRGIRLQALEIRRNLNRPRMVAIDATRSHRTDS